MTENDKDKHNSITTKMTCYLTLQQHLPHQPSINQSGNTITPKLFHTGTKQLSQQKDHYECAEELISSKRESGNYFATHTNICLYWQKLEVHLCILNTRYVMHWCYILISYDYFIICRLQYGSGLVAWHLEETNLLISEYPHITIHYNENPTFFFPTLHK